MEPEYFFRDHKEQHAEQTDHELPGLASSGQARQIETSLGQ